MMPQRGRRARGLAVLLILLSAGPIVLRGQIAEAADVRNAVVGAIALAGTASVSTGTPITDVTQCTTGASWSFSAEGPAPALSLGGSAYPGLVSVTISAGGCQGPFWGGQYGLLGGPWPPTSVTISVNGTSPNGSTLYCYASSGSYTEIAGLVRVSAFLGCWIDGAPPPPNVAETFQFIGVAVPVANAQLSSSTQVVTGVAQFASDPGSW